MAPPKKKGKKGMKFTAPKKPQKTTISQPQPDPKFCNKKLPPLVLTDDVSSALLPWLAKGFAPVKTSGAGNLCGANALWKAFREAREALKEPDEKLNHLTQKTFHEFINSERYNALVDKVVKAQLKLGFITDEDEFREVLTQNSNIDIVSASSRSIIFNSFNNS